MTREEQSVKMGKRLKALREGTMSNGKKLSHEKLKETLNELYGVEISRDSLMNYEVSDINHSKFGTNLKMNVEYLNCFSNFYGVSADYLLGLTDKKTKDMRIKSICEYTGLSESAAYFLNDLNSDSAHTRDIYAALNVLLEESRFDDCKIFWERIFLFLFSSSTPYNAQFGKSCRQLNAETVLSLLLEENNQYLHELRKGLQRTEQFTEET
jgi:hypothetical protein